MRIILLLFIFYSTTCSGSITLPQYTEEKVLQELKLDTLPAPTPLEFDEERMQSYKEDPDFNYSDDLAQDNWWTRFKRYLGLQYQRFLNWLFGDYETNAFLSFFIETLPYLIISAIVLFAVWIFNRMNPGAVLLNEPEEGKVFLSEDEEIIKTSDISELIKKAVAEENYRLAIRYYFLLILQQLTKKDFITYEFSKTDEDYLREIKPENLQKQFKQLTRIYDFIWYGNFEASRDHFLRTKREFEKMQALILQPHE